MTTWQPSSRGFFWLYFTRSNIGPPEDNLKITIWSLCKGSCCEVWVPCNGDKSQFVELLYDGEVTLYILSHFMEFNTNLTHIGERTTKKQLLLIHLQYFSAKITF